MSKIVGGPSRISVNQTEVLKIAEFSLDPLFCESPFEKLLLSIYDKINSFFIGFIDKLDKGFCLEKIEKIAAVHVVIEYLESCVA